MKLNDEQLAEFNRIVAMPGAATNPSQRLPKTIYGRYMAGETVPELADDYVLPKEQIEWGIRIAHLLDELSAAQSEIARWKKAIEGLTPSGSEYVDDPEACAAYIRKRTKYPRIILELQAELSAARKAVFAEFMSAAKILGLPDGNYTPDEILVKTGAIAERRARKAGFAEAVEKAAKIAEEWNERSEGFPAEMIRALSPSTTDWLELERVKARLEACKQLTAIYRDRNYRVPEIIVNYKADLTAQKDKLERK